VVNGEWRAINQIMERPDGRNMEETWNNSENSLGIYTRDCAKRKIVGKLNARLSRLHANLFWQRFKKMPTSSFACASDPFHRRWSPGKKNRDMC
jgi:hypothetical protein